MRAACPVCGDTAFTTVTEQQGVPVHQNLVCATEREALDMPRGDLTMVACHGCGLVFNRTFDANRLRYSGRYDNTQLASGVFQEHVSHLVDHLVGARGVRDHLIVEVGCGKGEFLRALVMDARTTNRGIGFDPSCVGPCRQGGGRLRFERRLYDMTCADVQADVVIGRHVIEHVPEPLAFLGAIVAALGGRPDARLFLETPCVAWILEHGVVWDFFYEHCSLFSAGSLATACEVAGFRVTSVDHVFGGQYLWLEASAQAPDHVRFDAGALPAQAARFAAVQAQRLGHWQARVRALAQDGRVALWGAGAKGVTFANLVDPHRAHVNCLVDINPNKQGGYVPSTGHPIVAPSDLADRKVTTVVLLNPNYRHEVQAMLREQRSSIDVLDFGAVGPS